MSIVASSWVSVDVTGEAPTGVAVAPTTMLLAFLALELFDERGEVGRAAGAQRWCRQRWPVLSTTEPPLLAAGVSMLP